MNDAMLCEPDSASTPSAPDGAGTPDGPHPHEHLDVEGIQALLAYEETHGHRDAVIQALTERLLSVRSGTDPAGPLGDRLPRNFVG